MIRQIRKALTKVDVSELSIDEMYYLVLLIKVLDDFEEDEEEQEKVEELDAEDYE